MNGKSVGASLVDRHLYSQSEERSIFFKQNFPIQNIRVVNSKVQCREQGMKKVSEDRGVIRRYNNRGVLGYK